MLPLTAFVLMAVGSLSLPDDAPISAVLDARLRSRWRQLRERMQAVSARRHRLQAEREREQHALAEHDAKERLERRLNERVEWNASSGTWVHVGDAREHANTTDHNGTAASDAAAMGATALAQAADAALATAAARRAVLLRKKGAASISLPSPPPPLGPAVLLRAGQEGGCLHFTEPLELLARASCDFDLAEQRFVWDTQSRTLRKQPHPPPRHAHPRTRPVSRMLAAHAHRADFVPSLLLARLPCCRRLHVPASHPVPPPSLPPRRLRARHDHVRRLLCRPAGLWRVVVLRRRQRRVRT